MKEENKPEPPARQRVLPVVVLVTAGFILGLGVAGVLFPTRPKINAADPVSVGLVVGRSAPDFTLNTLDGNRVSLSDLAGQPVVINFWASWCIPCREEMPKLVQAYETHKSEGFMILGVNLTSIDSLPDVQGFVNEFDVTFPVLLDTDGVVAWKSYHIPGIPTSIFVNRDGTIERVQIGKMSGEQIDQYVAVILK